MKWSLKKEAKWMVALYVLPPLIGIVIALLLPWIRRHS
jgi:hypothetical protein